MHADAILRRLARLHPRVIDLSLGRLDRLLARLGNPERRLPPVIHVAGTNGKGSTIAFLRAIHQAAGRTVHSYTSPHLVRVTERYVVAGNEIDPERLAGLLLECERANAGDVITQFEIMTAAALLAFAETPADLLLLEVGLGGRLDATNVIERPALSMITPVSLDHQQYLGDTIAAIAAEKAGILKPGVPAVISAQPPEARQVIVERARACGSPLAIEGRDWSARPDGDGLVFSTAEERCRYPRPALTGAHQIGNAGAAVAAARLLRPQFPVSGDALAEGLASAVWPARLHRLTEGPMCAGLPAGAELWVDGGHNADAGRIIADEVRRWRRARPSRPVVLVFGGLNSRRPESYLRHFRGLVEAVRTVAIPGEANSVSATDAADSACGAGLAAEPSAGVEPAVHALCSRHGPQVTVLICGSLYLAGHVLADHA